MNEPVFHIESGWTFRIQVPSSSNPKGFLIAIHGWTGNENSMAIFTRNLLSHYFILYPRAPFISTSGGYSWAREAKSVEQDYALFQAIGIELIERIQHIRAVFHVENLPISLMGFSQGAALAMTISLEPNFPTQKAALLAGFLPVSTPDRAYSHLPAYLIAHGTHDDIVPLSHAHQLFEYLQKHNARVDFCETDTGHKLGTACVKKLENFFHEEA
jgi:phospholipase/carboxylesterase